MRILILSDGKDGHLNQSIGIAEILRDRIELSYDIHEARLKLNFLRGLIHIVIKKLSKKFDLINVEKILNLYKKIDIEKYHLIVSTGGSLRILSAALARKYNIKNIHNGSLRGFSSNYFTANISIDKTNDPSAIHTLIPPNKFKPLKYFKKKNRVLFLIGGNGSGYKIKKRDIKTLCKNIQKYSSENKLSPIIVTSRRTKKSHEEILKTKLINFYDNESIWYHENKLKLDLAMLFKSIDLIFVSEDSSSMISESICSGLPVYTIAPIRKKQNLSHTKMLQRYESQGFIKRLNFDSDFKKETKHRTNTSYEKISNIQLLLKISLTESIKNLYQKFGKNKEILQS